MLHEIYCEQFHQKRIVFNPGLSVVLGTNAGDNSIGKSTFLLIIDYVFGGSTYAGTTDIIENVGSHDIYFSFIFGEEIFRFLYKGIIIKHNKTEPTYTKTSLFLCEKRRFFMARTEKGVVATI